MSENKLSTFWLRLTAGLVAVAIAAISRIILTPLIGTRVPYATFYAAIIFSSLFGGYIVGIITLILSSIVVVLWINPFFSAESFNQVEFVGLLLFISVSSIIIWLGERVRRANDAAAAANQKNTIILESISDAFYTLDHDWKFIYVNAQAEKYLEKSRDELLGQNVWEKFPMASGSVFEQNYRKAVAENQAVTFEALSTFSKRWLEINVYPSAEGLSVYFRDITLRKLAEKEKEELLAKEKQARIEAEYANRFKDEFLATVSHELRTPLNAILGWAKIAESGDLNGEKAVRAMEIISRNAVRQKQIIDDLLDVSRIITGKIRLNLQTVDLISILKDSIETFVPAIEAKNIKFSTSFEEEKVFFSGDADRLHQIFWNLISNAVKFTQSGGEVRIELKNEGNNVRIIVKDTGEGISAEFLPFVFERFRQQEGGTSRRFGGLGLGLAIVRNLSEIHGGSVYVESEGINKGATFSVKLPLYDQGYPKNLEANTEAKLEKNSANTSNTLSGINVLVVEDEKDAAELVKFILDNLGAKTVTANSVKEAFEEIDKQIPDIIISDIGMPERDGYSFINQIRKTHPSLPAVALTAYNAKSDRERAVAEGFNLHLAKPLEAEKLIKAVGNLLDRKI